MPDSWQILNDFPLTDNGKLDRKGLLSPNPPETKRAKVFEAPETVTEKKLADIWGRILDVPPPGKNDHFFELGGDSLLATRLIIEIRNTISKKVALPKLFEFPVLAEQAHFIDCAPAAAMEIRAITELAVDAETIINEEPVPTAISWESANKTAYLFLTGATGFLGSFLLHDFLYQTQAVIYCLVRSASDEEAGNRLQAKLESCALWDASYRDRIIPIAGDLSRKMFGLSRKRYQELATRIDAICHNGAWTHFAYSYETLKPINVLGTREILRLATREKIKPVHHVSTCAVLPLIGQNGESVIRENDNFEYDGFLATGYPQSKWVSERLVRAYGKRGLPVAIYRPGMITGHSRTGVANPEDLVSRLIKGCIQIGAAPQTNLTVNVLPVDHVSRSIVHLTGQRSALGKTFHLVNPNPVSVSDIFQWSRSLGFPLEQVSYERWRGMLMNEANHSQENALFSLLPILPEKLPDDAQFVQRAFDLHATMEALKSGGIVFPSISKALMETYISYFTETGFIPQAPVFA